jgi:drug/metabolite transporter (DMT)-like permease
MNDSHGLHGKTFVLILLMVIFGPLGDVLLGKGMKKVGAISSWSPSAFARLFAGAFSSIFIWLGIFFLLLFFIAYLLVLSWADYSYVQPASASSYVVVALLGVFLLGEAITSVRWTGVLTICLGVVLVGGTPPRTTERG